MIDPEEYARVSAFFGARSDVEVTPLHRLAALASSLGLREVWLKDESARFGLNAFKILGVLYAFNRIMTLRSADSGTVVACASAGNHGRAVARAARLHGLKAKVYLPVGVAPARVDAIASEGAEVIVTDVDYEGSLQQVIRDAAQGGWLVVSDTSWPGYEEIPKWIMAGYTWLMDEAAQQCTAPPDVVFVQAGVGGLACAVASWCAWKYGAQRPFVIACEPSAAPCLLESVRAGQPVSVPPEHTIMACLQCAELSPVIWPAVECAIDGVVAVDDAEAMAAMRLLARPTDGDPAVVAGSTGACGLAALQAVMRDEALSFVRDAARLGPSSRVLIINTEGATDPAVQDSVLGS